MVRPRAEWMTPADDPILEVLSDISPKAMSASGISFAIDYETSYVARRCRVLNEHGLVERPEGTLYRITGRGQSYLDGELTREELES